MKKKYIVPTCEVCDATLMPLCASTPIEGNHTGGDSGAWSKNFWGSAFYDSEDSETKSEGFFD